MAILHQSHTDSKQTYRCITECAEAICHVLRRDSLSECDVVGKCVRETQVGGAVALESVVVLLCYLH